MVNLKFGDLIAVYSILEKSTLWRTKKPRWWERGWVDFRFAGQAGSLPHAHSRGARGDLEQFLDDLAAVGDLHRAAVLAGEGGFQRDAEGLADGSHHPPGFPSQAAQLCYGAFSSTRVQGQ